MEGSDNHWKSWGMTGVELQVERVTGVFFHQVGRAIQGATRSQDNLSHCVGSCRMTERLCHSQSSVLLFMQALISNPTAFL